MLRAACATWAAVALTAVAATGSGGCSSGEIDGELRLYLEEGNLGFYEDVVFPASRRSFYDELFGAVPLYLPLHLTYKTSQVDAIITQRGDLQITAHLTAGESYGALHDAGDYAYLDDGLWNGESDQDRYGEQLRDELDDPDRAYRQLDEDIRLILLLNLPDDDGWSASDWVYPVARVANYADMVLDEQDQEHPIDEADIELMSRAIIGGELFETERNLTFDETDGTTWPDEEPELWLESLTLPGDDGRFGHTTGSFDLYLTSSSFFSSSGFARFQGTFDVDVREDRWALDDLEVDEDLSAPVDAG